MADTDLEKVIDESMADLDARAAAEENSLRRQLAVEFSKFYTGNGWNIDFMSYRLGITTTQAKRLLHKEKGGELFLSTICRACAKLGLSLELRVTEPHKKIDAYRFDDSASSADRKSVPKQRLLCPACRADVTNNSDPASSEIVCVICGWSGTRSDCVQAIVQF